MRQSTLIALTLLGAGLTAACRDATGPGATITADDAAALAVFIDDAGSGAIDENASAGLRLSLAPGSEPSLDVFTRTDDFEWTRSCPLGGTRAVSGDRTVTIDTEASSLVIDLAGTASHAACAFRTRRGVEITVDGSVTLEGDRELSPGVARGSQSYSGTLGYTTSLGGSGSCLLDFTTELSATTGSATRTVIGTVCGREVNTTTTWNRTG